MKNVTHFVVVCSSEAERAERAKILEAILMIKGVVVAYETDNKEVKPVPDLTELRLTARSERLLNNVGILSTSQLLAKSEIELIRVAGIGKKYISEIKDSLGEYGLSLRDHYRRW